MDTPILTVDKDATVDERLTDNAAYNILPARYLLKDESANVIESPEEMFERVAENVAAAEEKYDSGLDAAEARERFETAMKELRFMPNSPTLMNAGTDMNQLSACFVIEPEDKMAEENGSKFGEGIFPTATEAAKIFQSGGGVGYPFHHLRPKGSHISSTGGQASGPVSFMQVFNETCNQVKQGGKRRGAQMGILRVDHPDVGRFAVAKRDEGEFDNFNISVGVTDEFIEAVTTDDTYTLKDPTTDFDKAYTVTKEVAKFYNYEYRNNPASAFDSGEGETVDENIWRDYADDIEAHTGDGKVSLEEKWIDQYSHHYEEVDKELSSEPEPAFELEPGEPMELPARFLWDIMVDGAHCNGEPGIFYYDWTNEDHTFGDTEGEHRIEATNPCAEQPLSEYEACNLGHINLSLMLEEDASTWDEFPHVNSDSRDEQVNRYVRSVFDNELFIKTIETATWFLEDVVEQSDFPLDKIEETVDGKRKIGVGVMGLAQMLYQMGVPYDSEIGRDISSEVLRIIQRETALVSKVLAEERGVFDDWEKSKWANPAEYPDWFKRHTGGLEPEVWEDGFPVRNHNQTTIAPTGTTSMIGDTSGGCEPVYSVAFYKNVGGDIQGDDFLVEFDSYFLKTLEANDIDVDAVKREAEQQMENDNFEGVEGLSTVPDEFGEVFVTTEQIESEDHTLMQRRLQQHVDSGISKTINLPAEATRDDVDSAYLLALSKDAPGKPAKGITVYRDQSRDEQVKSTSADMSEAGSENGIEGGDDIANHLVEMVQSEEVPDSAVGILASRLNADLESVEGEFVKLCPECEEGVMQKQESCSLCPECGYSPCS